MWLKCKCFSEKEHKSSNSQKDAKCQIPSPFLRVEGLKGTTWEEGNYLHWICNFTKIDHEISRKLPGGSGRGRGAWNVDLRKWYYLCFLVQRMIGYRTSLCWGTKADLRVCIQDPWKGLRITTNVPAWCGRHLRLDSAHLAWVTCPASLPGLEGCLLHKSSFSPSLDHHLDPNQPLPTHADLAPGSSSPFIGQLLSPPSQPLVCSWPLLPSCWWPAPQTLSSWSSGYTFCSDLLSPS